MCDSDKSTLDYFNKHLKLMHGLGQNTDYTNISTPMEFFEKLEGEYHNED